MCGTDYEPDFHRYGCPGGTLNRRALIELLWDFFGGTISSTGYKVLDPHIGAIYGDGETLERGRRDLQPAGAEGLRLDQLGRRHRLVHLPAPDPGQLRPRHEGDRRRHQREEIAIFKDPVTDTSQDEEEPDRPRGRARTRR